MYYNVLRSCPLSVFQIHALYGSLQFEFFSDFESVGRYLANYPFITCRNTLRKTFVHFRVPCDTYMGNEWRNSSFSRKDCSSTNYEPVSWMAKGILGLEKNQGRITTRGIPKDPRQDAPNWPEKCCSDWVSASSPVCTARKPRSLKKRPTRPERLKVRVEPTKLRGGVWQKYDKT